MTITEVMDRDKIKDARIARLEGVMEWIVRVAAEPGPDTHMALRRIVEEARKALNP